MSSLRANHKGTFTARDNLQEITNTCQDIISRTIMHIDMDCFFVSVGLVSRPELKGRPVVVTHARGNKQSQGQLQDTLAAERRQAELSKYQERLGDKSSSWKLDNIDGTSSMSEIASCSYEARAKGVKNGMFLGPALKLCPDLVPISYDFVGYEKVSRVLYDTVASYTLDIMAVSCDEMFVDLTSLCKDLHMDPLSFVGQLRQEIFDKTGCCCSVGLGPNILLSRLATKKAKPNGQFLLTEESSGELLATMKVSELPGVGRSMGHKLSNLGVTIVGDLLKVSMTKLQQEFGQKTGSGLYKMARGQDDRQLELDHVRKTVSAEVNYGIRFKNWDDAEKFLQQLCDEVSRRLKKLSLVGRNLTLKLMMRAADAPEETSKYNGHGVCDNISRSVQLSFPTSKSEIFYKEVMSLVKLCNAVPQDMRGLGITVSKLEQENSVKSSENSSILKFVKPKTGNTKINEKNSDSLHSDTSKNENSFFSSPMRRNPFKVKVSDSIVPNQIDHNILESLPDDIKEEVMNEYKLKSKVDSTFEHEKTRLDFDIIEQLPTDIKEEIESEYNLNLNKPSTSRGKSSDLQSSIFIENEDSIDSLLEAENFPSTSNCDMSFSQVDKNVLHELPQELQLELTKHFSSRKKRSALQSESITAFDQIMKNGPTKTSPLKTIGSKRGRKKGSTNKKPSTSTSPKKPIKKNIPKNNENLDLYDSNSVDMDVFNCLPDDIKNEIETQMKINENITSKDRSFDQEQEYEPNQDEEELDRPTDSETEDLYGIDDPLPTFLGKSTIEDIRPMLKAWIFSNKPPNTEDIELLLEFLSDLIKIWRIDFVQILLKCLHRNISKLEDDSDTDWKNTWNNLVAKVQNVMMSSYGSPLLITEKF